MVPTNEQELKSVINFFFMNPQVGEMSIRFDRPFQNPFFVDGVLDLVTIFDEMKEGQTGETHEAWFSYDDYQDGDNWVVAKVLVRYIKREEERRIRVLEVVMWREKRPL